MNHTPEEKEQRTARIYIPVLEGVAKNYPSWINVSLLLAIVSRETFWGWCRGYSAPGSPTGKGDWSKRPKDKKSHYHGYGFFQIDIDAHPQAIANFTWNRVDLAADYVCKNVLESNYNYLADRFPNKSKTQLIEGSVAGYNCGAGNVRKAWNKGVHADTRTHGHDYSKDVLSLQEWWGNFYVEEKGETKPIIECVKKEVIVMAKSEERKKVDALVKEAIEKKDGQLILDYIKDETEDFIRAYTAGLLLGRKGKAFALNQGGDPNPERIGYALGVLTRALVLPLIEAIINNAIGDVSKALKDALKKAMPKSPSKKK